MNFFTSNFRPQRFVLGVFLVAAFMVGTVITFNSWFYKHRPNSDLERAQKAEQGEYEIIVIGSSRANAYTPYFEKDFKTLNLAAGGAKPYEMKRRLEHALKYSKPNKIVVDLGFFSFNQYWPGSETYSEYFFTTPETRSDGLHRLKRFAFYSLDYRNLFTNLGRFDQLQNNPDDAEEKEESLVPNKEAFFQTEEFFMRNGYNPTPYKQYKYSSDIFDNELRAILEMGYANNIELILITSPVNARLLQILDVMEMWPHLEHWKKQLVALNEGVAEEHNKTPFLLHDAMIFTPSTMVSIEDSVKLYTENSHFTPYLASKILEAIKLEGGKRAGHYVSISSQNIDRHLDTQRIKKDRYIKQNPDVYEGFVGRYEVIKKAKKHLNLGS